LFVPVAQDDALGRRAVELKAMYARPVGVTVDHMAHTLLAQQLMNALRAHVQQGIVDAAIAPGTRLARSRRVGQALRAANPDVRLFAMEPSDSPTLLCGEVDLHGIEGISDGFVPGIFARHRELVSEFLSVSSADAVEEMRKLASKRGLLCGPSSGAHVIAARRIRERFPELKTVVTVLADKGEKYLHDFYMSQPGEPDSPPLH